MLQLGDIKKCSYTQKQRLSIITDSDKNKKKDTEENKWHFLIWICNQ